MTTGWRSGTRLPTRNSGRRSLVDQPFARSGTALITLRSLVVYSTGFELRLLGEWAKDALGPIEDHIIHPHSEQFLRVAVEYAGGRRATNMDYALSDDDEDDEDDDTPPDAPFIANQHPQHIHPRATQVDLRYWVWSIPSEGDITVVCEWPAASISVSRLTVEGDKIRDAATRSQKLW